MNKHKPPLVIIKDFSMMKEVSFFRRIHGHLPDDKCGEHVLGRCSYREDGIAINKANEPAEILITNPEHVRKQHEVNEAVKGHWEKSK